MVSSFRKQCPQVPYRPVMLAYPFKMVTERLVNLNGRISVLEFNIYIGIFIGRHRSSLSFPDKEYGADRIGIRDIQKPLIHSLLFPELIVIGPPVSGFHPDIRPLVWQRGSLFSGNRS